MENADDALREKIAKLVADSGAKLVATGRPQRTLEGVFIEATAPKG